MEAFPGHPSAAPASPPRRRWGRFSLRTLLIAVTVASLAMALFSHRYDRQRRAVAVLEAVGADVYFAEPLEGPGPIESWLRARLPQAYFDEVREVSFSAAEEVDSMPHVSQLTSLKELRLNSAQVSDAGLPYLSGLTSLEALYLPGTQINDAGLAHVSDLTSLQILDLEGTTVSDAGLAHLSRLTSLQALVLRRTQVSDAGLPHLSGLSSLSWLDLRGTQVSEAGAAELQRSLPNCEIFR